MAAVTVYLARHGQAEGAHPQGDRARALTSEGRAHLVQLTTALRGLVSLTRVVSSPFVRARQSAELWAGAWGVGLALDEALGSGVSTGHQVLTLARQLGHGALLLGHNPEMAEAVSSAAGRSMAFPPGALAVVDLFPDGRVQLVWTRV